MNTVSQMVELLDKLAHEEYVAALSVLNQVPYPENLGWLIEASRVLDALHIEYSYVENKNLIPDYDILFKGWNPLVSILLEKSGSIIGLPIRESTTQSRNIILGALSQLGRYILLKHSVSMLKNGMADATFEGDKILFQMGKRLFSDHFLDALEADKFKKATKNLKKENEFIKSFIVEDIDKKLAAEIFPYDTGHGIIIGYNSTPEIDDHYLALTQPEVVEWRDQAGIHPDAIFGTITGADLISVASLLISFRLKHRDFVYVGMKKIPNANYYMSLTTWIDPSKLAEAIAMYTGMNKGNVWSALELLCLKQMNTDYFKIEPAPFFPLMIEISPGYWLAPVAGIYRNPLTNVKMFQEFNMPKLHSSLRSQREAWMISDLTHLFQGPRYVYMNGTARLKRGNKTVTDIDAAIFDVATGDLAIFQLKWQDFGSNLVQKQLSKAKNFTSQIDEWYTSTNEWIGEFGLVRLAQSLRLQNKKTPPIKNVYYFGLGRLSARFKSYGQKQSAEQVAICIWKQFIRLRFEIGPSNNVIRELHDAIIKEQSSSESVTPIPYEIVFKGQTVLFADMWNTFD